MDIGVKIQEQAQKTLFQDQTSKEAQEKMKEQLSQQVQEKMASTQQQVLEATQLAVQDQSTTQFASQTMTDYEQKLSKVTHTMEQLQKLIIEERKKRMMMESQLLSA